MPLLLSCPYISRSLQSSEKSIKYRYFICNSALPVHIFGTWLRKFTKTHQLILPSLPVYFCPVQETERHWTELHDTLTSTKYFDEFILGLKWWSNSGHFTCAYVFFWGHLKPSSHRVCRSGTRCNWSVDQRENHVSGLFQQNLQSFW